MMTANVSALTVSPHTTNSSTLMIGLENGVVIKAENANTASPVYTNIAGNQFLGSVPDIEFGLSENEIFGEMGVIDNSLRAGRAVAISDVNLIRISQHEFKDKLSESDPFISGLTRVLVARIRGLLKSSHVDETLKPDIETTNHDSES